MDEGTASSKGRLLRLLQHGEFLDREGRYLPWSSNYAFSLIVSDGELEAEVVYKPRQGERPLWDFPDGTLCLREYAAFLVSEALGWHIVPATVLRDGPHGYGMVQQRIQADPNVNYFTFGPEFKAQLRRIALFDHIANNADRKGGHCLLDADNCIWSIDHGICFHATPKLRSVIWDFAGEPIPDNLSRDLDTFCGKLETQTALRDELADLLSPREINALQRRVEMLMASGTYPQPGPGRNYPWPPV